MEIKDILSELITVSINTMNERGCPENFDLEDCISVMENYYEELDEIDEFIYIDDKDEYNFSDDEDEFYRGQD